jgi:hypothetical protein
MTTTETPAAPPPPAPAPKPSGFERLIGVLMSPSETFASIARQPDFAVPLIVFIIVSAITGFVFAQRVDFVAPAREAMEARGNMTEAQMESALRITGIISKILSYCAPVFGLIILLIIAAVLLLAFRLMGGEGDFKQAFSVTLYAWMPQIIKSVIITILVAAKSGVTSMDLPVLVRSNPGFLVSLKDHPLLFSLLTNVDLFGIWTLVLFIIGFSYVSKFSKGKSAAVVITVRVIALLIGLIGPAIQSMRK